MITARDFEDGLNNCKKTIGKVNLDSSQRKAVEEMVKDIAKVLKQFGYDSGANVFYEIMTDKELGKVQEKWSIIKGLVKSDYNISSIGIMTWIEPMEYYQETNNTVTIVLPKNESEIMDIISKNFKDVFQSAISRILGEDYDVIFSVI